MDKTDHIVSEFKVGELVLVAEALGLAPVSAWGGRKVVDAIRIKLKKDGVPEDDPKDARKADLLDDFLYVDGWIDDDGNILKEGGGNPETVEEFMTLHKIEKALPDCFGFADDGDPACKKCVLYLYCAEDRIANLPGCFGIMYSVNEVECDNCLEAPFCKSV